MKNLYCRILTRPCFIHIGKTLASNPGLLKFLHTPCQRFRQHSEPCLYPCFSIFQQTMVKGWRGAGVKCERVESKFNQELTPIWPRPNPILFDPLHCYKNSFTLLEITIGQEKIHGWSAQPV